MSARRHCRARRGGALLAVLWLTAALSAIAFSVANTVRGEIERTGTSVDGVRAYYIAAGAVERAILYMLWGPGHKNPDGSTRFWQRDVPRLHLRFPAGDAQVEIIPATSKLNINTANEQDLFRLLVAIGAEPGRAAAIVQGILAWRGSGPGRNLFEQLNVPGTPSFGRRPASFEEIEEVLLVEGMTPELFYGTYVRDPEGRLVRRSGFRDCASVYGAEGRFDVNSADPALLVSLGIDPAGVEQMVVRRREQPFRNMGQLEPFRRFAGPGAAKLGIGGITIYTIRATARPRLADGRLSDLRRSVSATVKLRRGGFKPPFHILRWHDNAPTDTSHWR